MVDHVFAVDGVTYANLAAAIATLPSNLNAGGAGGDRWWIQMSAGSHGTGTIGSIAGADATHFIEVSAAPGVDRTSVVTGNFESASHYTYWHDCKTVIPVQSGGSGNYMRIENIIANGSSTIGLYANATSSKIVNCSYVGTSLSPSAVAFYGNGEKYGCIAKMMSAGYGYRYGSSNNCVASTPGTCFYSGVTGDNNCSTDSSAPGVLSLTNQLVADMKFVDYNNNDFHTAADSILQRAGANKLSIYTADADGVAIPADNYPIGPYYTPNNLNKPPTPTFPMNHSTDVARNVTFTWTDP